jgi:hypothetical protein
MPPIIIITLSPLGRARTSKQGGGAGVIRELKEWNSSLLKLQREGMGLLEY